MAINKKSISNLVPIKKGQTLIANAKRGRKKELRTLFKEAVKKSDWLEILNKAIEQAKEGDNKAREFLFDRYYGKVETESEMDNLSSPTLVQNNFQIDVKGKSASELIQLLQEAETGASEEGDDYEIDNTIEIEP